MACRAPIRVHQLVLRHAKQPATLLPFGDAEQLTALQRGQKDLHQQVFRVF